MIALTTAGTGRFWLPLAGGALVLALIAKSLYLAYDHGRSVERSEWQVRWSDRDAGDQQSWGLAQASARTEEQRRQTAVNEIANNARREQAMAIDDAGRADAAGERLRVASTELASRASCTSGAPGATHRGEAARRAAMVLSDLLNRADVRAGELAEAYDRSRIAGLACEKAYRALKLRGANIVLGE